MKSMERSGILVRASRQSACTILCIGQLLRGLAVVGALIGVAVLSPSLMV